jgi:hypothetical protein
LTRRIADIGDFSWSRRVSEDDLVEFAERIGDRPSVECDRHLAEFEIDGFDEADVAVVGELIGKETNSVIMPHWSKQIDIYRRCLALVYRVFFGKHSQSRDLDDALEAVDGALEEFR